MNPLIKGISEPKLGDIEKGKEEDKEYKEPLKTSLNDQKNDALSTLYGVKTDNNEVQKTNNESKEVITDKMKIEENPHSPLIDGFIKNGLLSVEEGEIIKATLIKGGDLKENLGNIEGIDKTKTKQVLESIKYLSKPEAKKECLEKFNKDFAVQIDGLKQVVDGSTKGKKELVGKNKDLIELIGGNYLSLENIDGSKEGNNKAMDRAFKTSLNQLMDGKSFKRPETFNDMKNVVKNPDLSFEERFSELKKIDSLIDIDQSRGNLKQAKAFGTMKKGVENNALTLEDKFNKFKAAVELANINNNDDKYKELIEQASILKEEAENSGEVFISGDIDVLLNGINEGKEQA